MGDCANCGGCGNCGNCGGCMELTETELALLNQLAQIPFLPVGRALGEDPPIFPEDPGEASTLGLQLLEKRGLISIDYHTPLAGFHNEIYDALPLRGSFGLTQRGQLVVELLEIQGLG